MTVLIRIFVTVRHITLNLLPNTPLCFKHTYPSFLPVSEAVLEVFFCVFMVNGAVQRWPRKGGLAETQVCPLSPSSLVLVLCDSGSSSSQHDLMENGLSQFRILRQPGWSN